MWHEHVADGSYDDFVIRNVTQNCRMLDFVVHGFEEA